VVETDIANCFEAIPHDQLMAAVEQQICDQDARDETIIGGVKPGRRGRGADGKALVAVAVSKPALALAAPAACGCSPSPTPARTS
jgi:hypothetical protein